MVKDTAYEFLRPFTETICTLNEREEVYVFDAWNPRNRDEAENIIGWHLDDVMCEEAGTKLKHLVPFAVAIRDEFEDLIIETTVLRSIEDESRYACIYFYDRTTDLVFRCKLGELLAMDPVSEIGLSRICAFGRKARNARELVG
jgi:hypothetical protein